MSGDIRERLAQLRLPVIVAPMFLVSGIDLVVASCRAGVVGSFPAPNTRNSEELDVWLGAITAALRPAYERNEVAPWAVNLVTHRTNPRLPTDLAVVERYQPPIVITALGSPAPVVEAVHAYGGLVFADVNSVGYARKAAAAGADGLILVCAGAGGHTGHLCNYVFVEEVRQFFDGIIILAGGIASGKAILASEIMGADFAYMGTKFIATTESMAHAEYRQMVVDCSADDLVVSKAFTGANASMMKPSILAMGLDLADVATRQAKMNFTGLTGADVKPWKGILSAGQGIGTVSEVLPTGVLIDRLDREYADAKRRTLTLAG